MFNHINNTSRENLINKHIAQNEIYSVPMSVVNDIGIVFIWKNRFFRAINYNAHDKVKHMFGCGMIDELVRCNLFPNCRITDYKMDGFSLIIEINKLIIVSYPYEWSFTMLKDAAITVLKVNIIANKYGYQTKDSHPFNITFDGTRQIFIDLGSFVKLDNEFDGWIAYEEFIKSFYYPLKIFSKGNAFIGRSIISNEQGFLSHYEYLIYCNKLFIGYLNSDFINRLINFIYRVKRISTVPNETIKKKLRNSLIAKVIVYLKRKNIFPFQHTNYSLLMKKIERISMKRTYSEWGSYQNELHDNKGEMISSPRFDRICSIIKSYDIKTSIELGANQGVLSRLLLKRAFLDCVIATDNDDNAIDMLYILAKKDNKRIYPLYLNCLFPITTSRSELPWKRFVSDVVIALALTHHLILRHDIRIDIIFKMFAKYTKKYILVEFMPLGLWDGKYAPPLPAWYSIDWFRSSFEVYFNIILEEQLEENRILFFGKKLE